MRGGFVTGVRPGVTIQMVKGEFEDLRERVVLAIKNRGLVLNYTAYIGNMLDGIARDALK